MAFWSEQYNAQSKDPKRGFKFKVTIIGLNGGDVVWFAKKIAKPSFSVTTAEHHYLGHKFYFPSRVEWDAVSMTLVDPVSPGAVAQTNAIISAAGYQVPGSPTDLETMSKGKSAAALERVQIEQIDANGNVIEAWDLKNPFVTKVGLSELSYDTDDLSEIELEFRFDWAVCTIGATAEGAQPHNNQLGTVADPKTFFDN